MLEDSCLMRWPKDAGGTGRRSDRCIRHVLVSPGTTVTDARFLDGSESGHPAVVEFEWR
jgi:hypothetical protein